MRLPILEHAPRYRGLYVFDFGEWAAVGYTSEEIAMLLESETYRHGKVYRIHRADPAGNMELQAVAPERFQLESGLFFYRSESAAAHRDFKELASLAEQTPPPCRAVLQLAETGATATGPFVTALIFPAEYDEDVGSWLLALDYAGGDLAEGGISHVTNFYAAPHVIMARQQLWGTAQIPARSADEVFAAVKLPVQRALGA